MSQNLPRAAGDSLQYAGLTRDRLPNAEALLIVARVCLTLPLAIGALMYAVRIFYQSRWLIDAGIVISALGMVGAFLGFGFLLAHRRARQREAREGVRQRSEIDGFQWFLVVVNVLMAGGFARAVVQQHRQYVITVVNATGTPVERFRINAPGLEIDLGPISAFSNTSHGYHVSEAGRLGFEARQGTAAFSGGAVAELYPSIQGTLVITITAPGEFTVHGK